MKVYADQTERKGASQALALGGIALSPRLFVTQPVASAIPLTIP